MKQNFEQKLTTKELEKFVNKQEQLNSKSGRETIIMWSVVIMGFAGLFIVMSNNLFRNDKNEQISNKKVTTDKAQFARAEVAMPMLREKSNSTIVHMSGIKEAAEVITFKVAGFQQNANYRFEFGDGMSRTMNSATIKHAYRNPGAYEVKLLVSYNNETKVFFEDKINIAESIEVADGALSEMRE